MSKKAKLKTASSKQEIPNIAENIPPMTSSRNQEAKSPPPIESTPCKTWVNEHGQIQTIRDAKLDDVNLLIKIAGTKDSEIATTLVRSGVLALEPVIEGANSSSEKLSECSNLIFQSLNDFQPKDVIEARLVTQATVLYQHGMSNLRRSELADLIPQASYYSNKAIKFFKLHNETIEAINRHRRGGEQRVIIQHLTADRAIVNNFPQGGGIPENRGDIPCSENAEQKPGQTAISHVASPLWRMEDAGCMADCAQAPKLKKDFNG